MIKVISFDLDGTLADENFDKLIWNEEIPKLYAEKYGLILADAKEKVFAEYKKEEGNVRWTDIEFWFGRFGLEDWDGLLNSLKKDIKLFPETTKVLRDLRKIFKLIIITQSEKKFMKLKLETENLESYFSEIFSTVHNFNSREKSEDVYDEITKKLEVRPEEIAHIGNHWQFDFIVPRKLGINAYYLDRENNKQGEFIVHDLLEFRDKLK
jgi:FMN phosphatase YigB (HAD superfamily)